MAIKNIETTDVSAVYWFPSAEKTSVYDYGVAVPMRRDRGENINSPTNVGISNVGISDCARAAQQQGTLPDIKRDRSTLLAATEGSAPEYRGRGHREGMEQKDLRLQYQFRKYSRRCSYRHGISHFLRVDVQ